MNISEIAKRAGVSPSAVSRYLNNGYLSEQKRSAIQKVIEETGYRPLLQAQSLRTRRTRTVGVILPKIDSYAIGSVVAGIDGVLEPRGFQLLLADTRNSPEKELQYLDTFDDQRVDGVILIGTVCTPRHLSMLRKSRVPVVVAGQQFPGVPCVYHDDYGAFFQLTQLVLSKGRRRLGYIGALPQDRTVGQERSRAFQDAVRAAGLEDQVAHQVIADFTMASGYEAAGALLEAWGPLDAVLCATDTIAAGALRCFRERGLHVPQDLLVTGHGDSDVSQVTSPALTTARCFYAESGASAAELLLERMKKPDTPPKEIKLGCVIVERASTGAPAGA